MTTVTSQLLLTHFWRKFRCRLLGTSRTDSNCHGDNCPGNIYPGDICPYQEYLSCYWPNFNETLNVVLWEHLEQISTIKLTFVKATFVLLPKNFLDPTLSGLKNNHNQNFNRFWHYWNKPRCTMCQCVTSKTDLIHTYFFIKIYFTQKSYMATAKEKCIRPSPRAF